MQSEAPPSDMALVSVLVSLDVAQAPEVALVLAMQCHPLGKRERLLLCPFWQYLQRPVIVDPRAEGEIELASLGTGGAQGLDSRRRLQRYKGMSLTFMSMFAGVVGDRKSVV